jgi:hypothetical protein
LFYKLPSFLTFLCPQKSFCFPCELSNWSQNQCKVLDKTFIKLYQTMSTWIYNDFCGTYMFIITYIFFKLGNLPSFETINPKIIIENTIKVHIFGFELMLYSMHFWKHNLKFCKWVSMSLYTMKLSMNIFMKLSRYIFSKCFCHSSLKCWKSILHSLQENVVFQKVQLD